MADVIQRFAYVDGTEFDKSDFPSILGDTVGDVDELLLYIGICHNSVFNRTLTVDWVRVGTTGYGSADLFEWNAGNHGIPPFDTLYGGPTTPDGGVTYFETAPNVESKSTYLEGLVSGLGSEDEIFLTAYVRINIVDTAFGIFGYVAEDLGPNLNAVHGGTGIDDHWSFSQDAPSINVPQVSGDFGPLTEGGFHTIGHRILKGVAGGIHIKRKFRIDQEVALPAAEGPHITHAEFMAQEFHAGLVDPEE